MQPSSGYLRNGGHVWFSGVYVWGCRFLWGSQICLWVSQIFVSFAVYVWGSQLTTSLWNIHSTPSHPPPVGHISTQLGWLVHWSHHLHNSHWPLNLSGRSGPPQATVCGGVTVNVGWKFVAGICSCIIFLFGQVRPKSFNPVATKCPNIDNCDDVA